MNDNHKISQVELEHNKKYKKNLVANVLLSSYAYLKPAQSMLTCGGRAEKLTDKKGNTKTVYSATCKNRLCNMCQSRKAYKRQAGIVKDLTPLNIDKEYHAQMITISPRNIPFNHLRDGIKNFNKAMNETRKSLKANIADINGFQTQLELTFFDKDKTITSEEYEEYEKNNHKMIMSSGSDKEIDLSELQAIDFKFNRETGEVEYFTIKPKTEKISKNKTQMVNLHAHMLIVVKKKEWNIKNGMFDKKYMESFQKYIKKYLKIFMGIDGYVNFSPTIRNGVKQTPTSIVKETIKYTTKTTEYLYLGAKRLKQLLKHTYRLNFYLDGGILQNNDASRKKAIESEIDEDKMFDIDEIIYKDVTYFENGISRTYTKQIGEMEPQAIIDFMKRYPTHIKLPYLEQVLKQPNNKQIEYIMAEYQKLKSKNIQNIMVHNDDSL